MHAKTTDKFPSSRVRGSTNEKLRAEDFWLRS